MRIDILSVIPELMESFFAHSILARAQKKGLAEVHLHPLRKWSTDKHQKVDDYPFGGGAGMVMMAQPIADAIDELKAERAYDEVIYFSPDGELFTQSMANRLSLNQNIILLCGHYKGVVERIREHYITREISIGDFVLSGGELAAAVVADALVRLLPGVLGNESSALSDSFQNGLVAPPVYTRPADFRGWPIPDVLLSGDHSKIEDWRHEQALARTRTRRPGMLNEQ